MGSLIDSDVCPKCGKEFWYEITTTGEYRKLTPCDCDKKFEEAVRLIERALNLTKEPNVRTILENALTALKSFS